MNDDGEDEGSVTEECDVDDDDEGGGECVICMSEPRDTLILPCRHLCLCQLCADSLRYQANNCPICRAPFRALLQIRALKKIQTPPEVFNLLVSFRFMSFEITFHLVFAYKRLRSCRLRSHFTSRGFERPRSGTKANSST